MEMSKSVRKRLNVQKGRPMMEDRQITHFVGDDCPGGHKTDPKFNEGPPTMKDVAKALDGRPPEPIGKAKDGKP